MPRQQMIWACEHGCRKKYTNKRRMEKHEVICFRNPDRRACPSCLWGEHALGAEECEAGVAKESGLHQVNCPSWESRDF